MCLKLQLSVLMTGHISYSVCFLSVCVFIHSKPLIVNLFNMLHPNFCLTEHFIINGKYQGFLEHVRAGKIFLVLKPESLVLLCTTLPLLVDSKHFVDGFCAVTLVMKEMLEPEKHWFLS